MVRLGPQPEKRVGKSKSDVEKGGIQTATVKAPGRRNRGVKNIWSMATGRSVLLSPGYKLELILTDPEAHGQAKSTATPLPGPQPRALCSPQHTPGQNPIPALRVPGENWQLLGSAAVFCPGSRCPAGGGRGLSRPRPRVRVEGRVWSGKKLVVSLALLLIKGLHT